MVKYKIVLDVKRLRAYQIPLEVKEEDAASRYIHATLVDSGVPISLENTVVTFFARKKDKTIVCNNTEIEDDEEVGD